MRINDVMMMIHSIDLDKKNCNPSSFEWHIRENRLAYQFWSEKWNRDGILNRLGLNQVDLVGFRS